MATSKTFLVIFFLLCGKLSFSQFHIDSLLVKIDPQKWSASIEKKAERLEEKIISKSQKTLSRLQRQETKVYNKMLHGKDSLLAKARLAEINDKYKKLQHDITQPAVSNTVTQYIPKLDTLGSALKFLDQNGVSGKVKDALTKTQSLQDKFQQAEEIKKFIRERRQQLTDQLAKLGMVQQLKKFNKEVYYYSQQIHEYKETLRDSKKAERKAIDLLSKTKFFQDFMQKNSMLASLFRLPGDPNDPLTQANSAGLQTRVQVNNLIQQQITTGGPNTQAQFTQNVQAAQSQLTQLKNKITSGGGNNSDDIMPEGFKPNNQRTKSFWRRIELGTNTQTQRATYFFPAISDLGLSLGYKLNDKSIIGIGASYKLGLGRGWNNIKVTNEGAGLRSFIDWKFKGSFWLSGGYEMNYKTAFDVIDQLRDYSAWQSSGLLGMSKVVSVKSKFFEKTKLQLLWDFLSYQQIPKTQPLIFRIGYNLK